MDLPEPRKAIYITLLPKIFEGTPKQIFERTFGFTRKIFYGDPYQFASSDR